MNIRKLLAAASVLALSATSAHAVDIVVNTPAPAGQTPAFSVASELDGVQTATGEGVLNFNVNAVAGTFSGGVVRFVVTLPQGVQFSQGAVNGDVTATDAGAGAVAVTPTIAAGGSVGSSTVTYDVDLGVAATATSVIFNFDGKLAGCPAAGTGLTVTASQGGAPEGGGTGTGTSNAVVGACVSGLQGGPAAITPGTPVAQLGDFTTLDTNNLGTFQFGAIANVARSFDGSPLDATDLDAVSIPVTFSTDTTGIESLNLVFGGGNTVNSGPATGNTFNIPVNVAADLLSLLDGNPDTITIVPTALATDAFTAQSVTLGTTAVTLDAADTNANLGVSSSIAGGPLATITRAGQNSTTFAWNSGAGRSTNSVYRITTTGLADGTYGISVTLTNASPASANSVTRGTFNVTDNQALLQSANGFGVVGLPAFSNGDVQFNFEVAGAVNVDRLLLRGNTLASSATLD